MDHDDLGIGRLLTRREALTLLGAAGLTAFLGCTDEEKRASTASPSTCVVRPELTEGPYFVDERLNRSDIRPDPSDGEVRSGTALDLRFIVSRLAGGTCIPLPGAIVDVWHCDALGVYSDVADRHFDTTGKKFLRGYQTTDATGIARFTTIYPGWYQGRAVHVHFKIRSGSNVADAHEFTSQLFFDDALTDAIHARQPYAAKGTRDVRNEDDGIYRRGGEQLVLAASPNEGGYAAAFDVAWQM